MFFQYHVLIFTGHQRDPETVHVRLIPRVRSPVLHLVLTFCILVDVFQEMIFTSALSITAHLVFSQEVSLDQILLFYDCRNAPIPAVDSWPSYHQVQGPNGFDELVGFDTERDLCLLKSGEFRPRDVRASAASGVFGPLVQLIEKHL